MSVDLESERDRHRVTAVALEREKSETERLQQEMDELRETQAASERSAQRTIADLRQTLESERRQKKEIHRLGTYSLKSLYLTLLCCPPHFNFPLLYPLLFPSPLFRVSSSHYPSVPCPCLTLLSISVTVHLTLSSL